MKGKIRKRFLKSALSFLLAFTMLISQGVNAFALDIGVGIDTGDIPAPNITKAAENLTRTDGTTVVGDTLQYTITIMNDEEFSTWKNVWLYDCIPTGLDFDAAAGVKVNGSAALYDYNSGNRELSLFLGDIMGQDEDESGAIMEKEIIIVSFQAQVNESAYETTIQNTVSLEGDNGVGEATDDGTYVGTDVPDPAMEKKATNVTSGAEGTAVVGDVLEYAVTLSNNKMNSVWKNVVLTDTIPEGVDFDSSKGVQINGTETTDYSYDETTRVLTVAIGKIEGGDSVGNGKDTFVVTFQVTVNESAYNTIVTNTAVGKGDNGEMDVEDPGTDVGSDVPVPEMEKKAVNVTSGAAGTAVVGDVLEYAVTLSNSKTNSEWKNVVLTDTIPQGVDFNSSNGVKINGTATTDYSYDEATRVLTVAIGNIEGGDSVGTGKDIYVVTFQVTVNESAYNTTVINTAVGKGDNEEKTVTDDGTEVGSDTPKGKADKAVSNVTSGAAGTAVVGDTLEYKITASNEQTNSVWKNVIVTDELPSGVDFDSSYGIYVNGAATTDYSYDEATRVLTVNLGDLEGGDAAGNGKDVKEVTFRVIVNESAYNTAVTNVAEVGGKDVEDPGTDVGSDVPVPEMEKKAVNVTSGAAGTAVVGDVLEYAVTLSNSKTNSEWKNVVLTDTIPQGVDFNSGNGVKINGTATTDYSYDEATRVLTVAIGNIEGGDSVGTGKDIYVVTFQVTVNESAYNTTVINTAVGKGDNGEKTVTEDGTEVGSDTPKPAGGKTVKNLTRNSVKGQVGDRVRYTITVSNAQTNSVWPNVYIWDTIPVEVDFDKSVDVTLNGAKADYTYDANARMLTVAIGNIEGGKEDGTGKTTQVLVFEAVVNERGYNKNIYNTASIDSVSRSRSVFAASDCLDMTHLNLSVSRSRSAFAAAETRGLDVTDDGIEIGSGDPELNAAKSVENLTNPEGKNEVGDTLQYTITASNESLYSIWKNVTIQDTIPEGVDFDSSYGVYVNGEESGYTYEESTRLLTIDIGDIRGGLADGADKDVLTVVFKATVNEDAYGKSINNIADLIGDNGEISVDDGGITIEAAKYRITYKANGGVGDDIVTDAYEAGSIVAAEKNTFIKDGYSFVNWNTKEDGSGTSYEAGSNITLDSNITLYAKWKEKSKQNISTANNAPTASGSSNSGGKTASNVKTGDDTNLLLWVSILGLSCAMSIFLRRIQKNSRRKNNKAM